MVEIRDGIFLESFAPWNDLGVDGRCVLDNGETIIFQAKRLRYSRKQLLKELKTETERLNTLSQMGVNIVRYILVVACDIEVAVKNEVMELFRPYIKSPTDIIDRNILNHLLDDKKYREVERRYSELLIPNTRVLFQSLYDVVNAPLVERSEMHFGAAVKSAKYFVETGILNRRCKN